MGLLPNTFLKKFLILTIALLLFASSQEQKVAPTGELVIRVKNKTNQFTDQVKLHDLVVNRGSLLPG